MKTIVVDGVNSKEELIATIYKGISKELSWAGLNWDAFDEIFRCLDDYLPNENLEIVNKDLSQISKHDLFLYKDTLLCAKKGYEKEGNAEKLSFTFSQELADDEIVEFNRQPSHSLLWKFLKRKKTKK